MDLRETAKAIMLGQKLQEDTLEEMKYNAVMKKIKDGYWEAMSDVKKGQHVEIRDTDTGKRKMIMVESEELEEAKKKKLDKVDKDELDNDYEGRDDKDIDNDGDEDESDKYLHKRRKAVAGAIKKATIEERVDPNNYSTGSEKSQFGGYRPVVKHKTKGHTMYAGDASYKTPKHAKAHAQAYLSGYAHMGDQTANRKADEYHKANKAHHYTKEEVENLDELSKKTLGSYIKKAKNSYVGAAEKMADNRSKGKPQEKTAIRKFIRRNRGIDMATDKLTKEETDQLDEISKKTLGRYITKASDDKATNLAGMIDPHNSQKQTDKHAKKYMKRSKGITKAVKRLTKEEADQLDELSKKTLGKYVKKAAKDMSYNRSAMDRYPNTKRGDKAINTVANRTRGIKKAVERLTKDD